MSFSELDGAEHYVPGGVVVWWQFSSSTVSRDVLDDDTFLGTSGKRTLFTIKVATARAIQDFSALPKENELLILPGTPFKVGAVTTEGDLTTIELEEDEDAPDMIDSGEDHYTELVWGDAGGFYDEVDPEVFATDPMPLPGGATEPLYRPVFASDAPDDGANAIYGEVSTFSGDGMQSVATAHVVADDAYEEYEVGGIVAPSLTVAPVFRGTFEASQEKNGSEAL